MPAHLTDIQQLASAVWEVFRRIEHFKGTGKPLQGLKWHREGKLQNNGVSDMPSLQPRNFEMDTLISPGAPRQGNGGKQEANVRIHHKQSLWLHLITNRDDGFIRRDPASGTEKKGHLEWLALVCDAIETRPEDGRADARLCRTLREPVGFSVRVDEDASPLSCSSLIEVILPTRSICRAERAYTLPQLGDE